MRAGERPNILPMARQGVVPSFWINEASQQIPNALRLQSGLLAVQNLRPIRIRHELLEVKVVIRTLDADVVEQVKF